MPGSGIASTRSSSGGGFHQRNQLADEQLSLRIHDGPVECFKIGQSLTALRKQGVLIIGSGSLTHNLYEFRQEQGVPATYVKAFGGITHGVLAMDAFVLGSGASGTTKSSLTEPQHAAA